ncbi:hypothetical protein INT45_004610 [Circinella minor]|uniref:Nudix hydrolase domain-containing protein n=1 Tax=Circinella minor TaxID=1195481 RepID=A0A8H7S1G5_9FUNG|nr:hypothetical protein INT45_004610 [Circinella minor]
MHSNILANATFEEILDDLSSRFIINVPEAEQQSPERICFQVEQAHWFYEDFHCPLMKQWAHQHERAYADFMQYRFRIPVCGAILLNENLDKCVLVKGWSSKSGWSFPRGKINQDEEFDHCAIREVFEETGFDTSKLIKDTYLEATIREQSIRLYVICGVPEDTEFRPQTRKEISQVEWFKLDELPGIKPGTKATGRFYMVVPFVCKLKSALPLIRKEYYRSKGGKHLKNNNNYTNQKMSRNNNKKSNNGKKASPPLRTPPSPLQDNHSSNSNTTTTVTPEPSVALKSLLGISSSVTPTVTSSITTTTTSTSSNPSNKNKEEEKVTTPESSVALKSLLGIQKPSNSSPEILRSTSNSTQELPSTERSLLEMLQFSQPSGSPSSTTTITSSNSSTMTTKTTTTTTNTNTKIVDKSKQDNQLHPLMQMFKDAGHEIKSIENDQQQKEESNPLMKMLKNAGQQNVVVESSSSTTTTTDNNGSTTDQSHPLIALLKGAERQQEQQSILSLQ